MLIPIQPIYSRIKQFLQTKFRDRVRFDKAECLLYSHDLGSPPPVMRPLIKREPLQGVVQPQNEAELSCLLRLANRYRIPLTPRGRGTSGYGGAIHRYGGRTAKVLKSRPGKLP